MKITINDRRKIFAIQEKFTGAFPNLKLEFLSKPSKRGGSPSKKSAGSPSHTIGDCRTIHDTGTITITPGMEASDLEKNFRNVFGLSVELFRQSPKGWVKLNPSDNLSLEEQNKLSQNETKK